MGQRVQLHDSVGTWHVNTSRFNLVPLQNVSFVTNERMLEFRDAPPTTSFATSKERATLKEEATS